jgi:hypothetical protein
MTIILSILKLVATYQTAVRIFKLKLIKYQGTNFFTYTKTH